MTHYRLLICRKSFDFLNGQPIHGGNTMNIIFLLIIMIITCNGCSKTFKNSHGLSCHRTSCLAAKEHSAYLAQKRLNLQKVRNDGKKIWGLQKIQEPMNNNRRLRKM